MSAPIVSMRDVTRRFGPVLANDRVSLEVRAGEVHALVGENGAGKSTLMKVLYGLHPPHAGTIEVDGRAVHIDSPAVAMKLGLGMVHQHFLLVDTLTVAENVVLGREPGVLLGAFSPASAERAVAALSREYRLPVNPHAHVAGLSVGEQQRVEILKVLYRGARVLILDEPTAVLTPQEVDELFGVLRGLRDHGTAIVLITHKLAEVKALADRVTVMRGGRVVGGGMASELSIEAMAELMVGRVPAPLGARAARAPGERVLEAIDLNAVDARGLPAVVGVSLNVRGGEIVGVAGVEGNGQNELVECLAGLRGTRTGRVRIGGRDVTGQGARAHHDAGLAHIPADRLRRGLVTEMTSAENFVLGGQREAANGPWLGGPALEARAKPALLAHDVRPPDPRARAGRLSGGNQQKLVVARELGRAHASAVRPARALIAAHPTRGVDLGAIDAIHRKLLAARDAGLGVLLVSSELSEILALSDRIIVLAGGNIVHETTPAGTDERTLGLHMTGRATLIDTPLDASRASGARADPSDQGRARERPPVPLAPAAAGAGADRGCHARALGRRRAHRRSRPVAARGVRHARAAGAGHRLRHRADAVQVHAAPLRRALGGARVPRRALQRGRRGPDVPGRVRGGHGRSVPAAARALSHAARVARGRLRGGAVGFDRRRAQGPLRRPRGHQHHHAQLHRVRAGGVVGTRAVHAGHGAHARGGGGRAHRPARSAAAVVAAARPRTSPSCSAWCWRSCSACSCSARAWATSCACWA